MPQIAQLGQINLAALSVPDLIVIIVPPQLLINGVPSNIVGAVGTATWGPVNVPTIVGGYAGYVSQFGNPQPRKYDLGSFIYAATQQGAQAFRMVRVTDGTDVAANTTVQTNCLTVTSLYTGSLGNTINFSIGNGSLLNTFRAVVSMGSMVPEVFDNISAGVVGFTVTAGSYTVCPLSLTIGGPPLYSVVARPTVAAGGTGYQIGDTITLSNSVQLVVTQLGGSGAVSSVGILNGGSVAAGASLPTNPVAQVSTSGNGTGVTFNLVWSQTFINNVQATAVPQLVVVGTPPISGTMSGYAANDSVTFSNGVTITVNTVTAGAISTFTITNPGVVAAGQAAPSTLVQTSTTGSGTGAKLTSVVWGLGQPVITNGGQGYFGTAPTVTINGGTGSGGSLVALLSYWVNMANALNNGISGLRGPSQRVTGTAGAGTATPALAGAYLTGGTDGANPASIGVTGTPALVGQDVLPQRTGMYAMRAALIAIGCLVDCDDPTTLTAQVSFGSSEGIYMVATGPFGQSISGATSTLANYGIQNFTLKYMLGDWCYINDPVSGAQRLISPQGFVAGFMGNQDPSQTPLNKAMRGIVGTQKSQTGIQYTNADLQAMIAGGVDVICNPNPGGNYFGLRNGINTSGNQSTWGDNYTRMTYFIARTIAQGCGSYVGQLQTPTERYQAQTTISAFLQNLWFLGLIGTADGSLPYSVKIDNSNNPQTLVALGYQFAYVKVIYLSVIRYFIVDLEGGQTVTISNQLPTGAATVSG